MSNQNDSSEIAKLVSLTDDIKSMIYVVRGQQVMLDSDISMLYQVDTKAFNQTVNRNIDRFPESFRFQLTKEEYDSLKSQFVTSKSRGGRRYRPYVFTEQGIAMLAGILRSEIAIQVSIRIMNSFVEMRRFIANNALLFEKVCDLEFRQREYQKFADERFSEIFQYIADHAESEQKIFFDGQVYDAFSLLTSIIGKAEKEIILIDGYVDTDTLNILAKKKKGVNVIIYTFSCAKITKKDIAKFNAQYPVLTVKRIHVFHDRFIILDRTTAYLIGSSIKDAGKKCFGLTLLEDPKLVDGLLDRLESAA